MGQVLALVSKNAGEKTVRNTVLRVEEIMGRFWADVAAPANTLKKVRKGIHYEDTKVNLVYTSATKSKLADPCFQGLHARFA